MKAAQIQSEFYLLICKLRQIIKLTINKLITHTKFVISISKYEESKIIIMAQKNT